MNIEIRDKLVEMFKKCCQTNLDRFDEKEPLEMESIEVMEFLLEVEDKFEIDYNDYAELSLHMESLGDMLDFLTKIVEQGGEK